MKSQEQVKLFLVLHKEYTRLMNECNQRFPDMFTESDFKRFAVIQTILEWVLDA